MANDIVMGSIMASKTACPGIAPWAVCSGSSVLLYSLPLSGTITFPSNVVAQPSADVAGVLENCSRLT